MTLDDKHKFAQGITKLAVALGEPMPVERIAAYFQILRDCELEAVLRAMDLHAKRSRFFPRPSELREGAQAMQPPRHRQLEDHSQRSAHPTDLFRQVHADIKNRLRARGEEC